MQNYGAAILRSHGVRVSTLDFESRDLSSNLSEIFLDLILGPRTNFRIKNLVLAKLLGKLDIIALPHFTLVQRFALFGRGGYPAGIDLAPRVFMRF